MPTRRSPDLVKATTEGVVLPPSVFGMTTARPFSMKLTQELVVPRSIPMSLDMFFLQLVSGYFFITIILAGEVQGFAYVV